MPARRSTRKACKSLASIPSKEVLLSQLLGLMQSPISRMARVLAALAEKRGAALPPRRGRCAAEAAAAGGSGRRRAAAAAA